MACFERRASVFAIKSDTKRWALFTGVKSKDEKGKIEVIYCDFCFFTFSICNDHIKVNSRHMVKPKHFWKENSFTFDICQLCSTKVWRFIKIKCLKRPWDPFYGRRYKYTFIIYCRANVLNYRLKSCKTHVTLKIVKKKQKNKMSWETRLFGFLCNIININIKKKKKDLHSL